MQAAGMGMQQRHQALQECQSQDQAKISEIVSHPRILNFNWRHHQSYVMAWQSKMADVGCPGVRHSTDWAICHTHGLNDPLIINNFFQAYSLH